MTKPDKIEKRCYCGQSNWFQRGKRWWFNEPGWRQIAPKRSDLMGDYCPVCGCYLAADGFAYRMVKVEEIAEVHAELLYRFRHVIIAVAVGRISVEDIEKLLQEKDTREEADNEPDGNH